MRSSLIRHIFTSLFPPPRFLEMPAVGLDISDEVVRFVELKRVRGHFELGMFGEKKIPPDVVEFGYIKDMPALTKLLLELRKEHNLKFVKVSLPEEKAYLFRTNIQRMEESEIRGALQFKIEENVPIALASAVYDYKMIKGTDQPDGQMDIGVTVIHRKVVDSYLSVIQNAGMTPIELRTEAQAIAHTFVSPNDQSAYIIIGVRETKTVLAIISNSVVQFTSTLPIGGKAIVESIAHQFEDTEKKAPGTGDKASTEMFQSLVNAASVLRDEVQKLFTYWEGHPIVNEGRKIERIVLSGSNAMAGLDGYLSSSFSIPVEIANAWKKVASVNEYIPPINLKESLDYIPAIGLALPYD